MVKSAFFQDHSTRSNSFPSQYFRTAFPVNTFNFVVLLFITEEIKGYHEGFLFEVYRKDSFQAQARHPKDALLLWVIIIIIILYICCNFSTHRSMTFFNSRKSALMINRDSCHI